MARLEAVMDEHLQWYGSAAIERATSAAKAAAAPVNAPKSKKAKAAAATTAASSGGFGGGGGAKSKASKAKGKKGNGVPQPAHMRGKRRTVTVLSLAVLSARSVC